MSRRNMQTSPVFDPLGTLLLLAFYKLTDQCHKDEPIYLMAIYSSIRLV